jgi:hypothetical protein
MRKEYDISGGERGKFYGKAKGYRVVSGKKGYEEKVTNEAGFDRSRRDGAAGGGARA